MVESTAFEHEGQTYTLLNVIGSATIPEGKYLLNPATGEGRGAVDPGHRQPGGAGAPGPPHVGGHQRHPEPEAALGPRAARGVPGDRGRAARHPLAELRGGLATCRSAPRPPSSAAASCAGSPSAGQEKKADDETGPGALYASGLIAAAASWACSAIGGEARLEKQRPWLAWIADRHRARSCPAIHGSAVARASLAFGAPRLLALLLRAQAAGAARNVGPEIRNPGGLSTLRGR